MRTLLVLTIAATVGWRIDNLPGAIALSAIVIGYVVVFGLILVARNPRWPSDKDR